VQLITIDDAFSFFYIQHFSHPPLSRWRKSEGHGVSP
jgi:hypothetical protein